MTQEYTLDKPVALTCPECGGAMRAEDHNGLKQFRCHIGHTLTGETMLAAQFAVLEHKLAACLVALKERAELCRQMCGENGGDSRDKETWEAARREAITRAEAIKAMLESEWIDTGRSYTSQMRPASI